MSYENVLRATTINNYPSGSSWFPTFRYSLDIQQLIPSTCFSRIRMHGRGNKYLTCNTTGCTNFLNRKMFALLHFYMKATFLFIVKLSLSLFSLTLRESWHYNHSTTPPTHRKLFKHLEVTYSQVWYIIGIVSSSPTHFHSEKIGLIRVTYDPPVSIRVNKYYSDL